MFTESIVTDRFVLRVPRSADGAAVYEAVADAIEQLRSQPASWPWADQEQSAAVSTAHCEGARGRFENQQKWNLFVFDQTTEQVVGNVEFHTLRSELNMWELGFWTRPSWQHRGVMSEALTALVKWMNQHNPVIKIIIRIDAVNTFSQKLAEKMGFDLVDEYAFESVFYKVYSSNPRGVDHVGS